MQVQWISTNWIDLLYMNDLFPRIMHYSAQLINSYASQDTALHHQISNHYCFIEVHLLTPIYSVYKLINHMCM